MGFKLLLISIFAFLFAVYVANPLVFAQTNVNVKFENHPQAGFPEQDVFILQGNQVVRASAQDATSSATLAKEVYSSATATDHDPFQLGSKPLGPFSKGADLGFTMADWLAGTGSGTYTVSGEASELNLTFEKLVPNGVYTVWCSRLSFPPNVKVVDKPCGKADGTENTFKADVSGAAQYSVKMPPLEKSTKETASVLAIAYHSDGKTYGPNPGDFGSKTHVQLFFAIPAEEAVAAESSPQTSAAVSASGGLTGPVLALVIIGAVVVGGLIWWFMGRSKQSSTP